MNATNMPGGHRLGEFDAHGGVTCGVCGQYTFGLTPAELRAEGWKKRRWYGWTCLACIVLPDRPNYDGRS